MIKIEIKNVSKAVPEFRVTNRKPEYEELNLILNESPARAHLLNMFARIYIRPYLEKIRMSK